MKKKIITCIVVVLLGSISMNAQKDSQISLKAAWGLKAETNLSNFLTSGPSGLSSKMKVGGTFGGFLNVRLTDRFALQGELLYHYKTSELNIQGIKGIDRYWGMEIPIYGLCQWDFSNRQKFYAGIGPYTEFGLSAELESGGKKINLYEKDAQSKISAMQDSNSGFGILTGYEFACGIQINASCKMSITNILNANSNSFNLHPMALSLGVGYRFH